jgi:hypothetical protein
MKGLHSPHFPQGQCFFLAICVPNEDVHRDIVQKWASITHS